ncbi:unnamed protein product [Symbiodinium pilosum]|uniref:Uncharacterized protein n=1 Tax=Symbiodinium pilosum TaxID=2952 RepID=A0A812Y6C0_SYMPI|nr:unnamed protein product [Symbiodinium pilosum]
MLGQDDSFDLLGLAAVEADHQVKAGGYRSATPSKQPDVAEDELAAPPPPVSLHQKAEIEETSQTEDMHLKRYTVRCEGRWRVRSAPSLSSKVIGTIAHGTVVLGEDCAGEVLAQGMSGTSPIPSFQQDASLPSDVLQQALESITALWVKVTRFEAQEPMGVSEIKRDSATGGGIYCLRRNAMGYGLYQSNTEPRDGPLILLPEHLGLELRLDAQRAASDRMEDVSLTWKLLGAAESVGRFFSLSAEDEAGINENIQSPSLRRPEDLFEVKQREQLKKAVSALRVPMADLAAKASADGSAVDLLAGLPKDLSRRFSRLRSALIAATSETNSLVVCPRWAGQEEMTGHVPEEDLVNSAAEHKVEGSAQDLTDFTAICEKLERTGSWTCVDAKLRQEVIAFSTKHAQEIQKYVRLRCKDLAVTSGKSDPSAVPAAPGLLDDLIETKPKIVANSGPAASALPLLPPPPSSVCSVRFGEEPRAGNYASFR